MGSRQLRRALVEERILCATVHPGTEKQVSGAVVADTGYALSRALLLAESAVVRMTS